MKLPPPYVAHYLVCGRLYRVGLRQMVFIWNGEEWLRSTTTAKELANIGTPIEGQKWKNTSNS